ncbi:hypothetical protein EDB86DRAFT_2835794 [Lactarius hatsudake]|nr:hypothetical protein EDB86DRAFT_2835794 [Lactarius hatsudake]
MLTDTATGSKHLLAGCQSVPVSQTRLRRHPSPPKSESGSEIKGPSSLQGVNRNQQPLNRIICTRGHSDSNVLDVEGGVKRVRKDEGDGTTRCICAISEDGKVRLGGTTEWRSAETR